MTLTTPITGQLVIKRLSLDIFYLHTNLATLASAIPDICLQCN